MCESLISVIVPVYNAEKYLECCLNSIICQTYNNFEVIIVNDGSTDNSFSICEKIAKNDNRISIYSKSNGGLSSARNYGLSKVNGKYVCFIDSDDCVHKNFLENLLLNIKKTDSDISVCGVKKVNINNYMYKEKLDNTYIVFDKKSAYNEMIKNNQFSGYVCNKLYKTEVIKKMENDYFREYMVEDFEFNSRLLNYCNKIVFTSAIMYYYYMNNNGITKSFVINERILNGLKAYKSILYQYDKNNIEYSDRVAYYALKYMYNINYRIYKLRYNYTGEVIEKKLYNRVMKSCMINKKEKVIMFLIHQFPICSYFIKNILCKRK